MPLLKTELKTEKIKESRHKKAGIFNLTNE
jgi:hypothetical protein